jgi:hypothetical protein
MTDKLITKRQADEIEKLLYCYFKVCPRVLLGTEFVVPLILGWRISRAGTMALQNYKASIGANKNA